MLSRISEKVAMRVRVVQRTEERLVMESMVEGKAENGRLWPTDTISGTAEGGQPPGLAGPPRKPRRRLRELLFFPAFPQPLRR